MIALPLLAASVSGLAQAEWNVSVLDHVLNLTTHGQHEQHDPVDHQDWPEHRNIKDLKPGAEKANGNRPGRTMPELELGQTADKRTELIILIGGEAAHSAIFEIVTLESGIEFGLEKSEEEVEEVDADRVCDDVPALGENDAQHKDAEEDTRSDPTVQRKWRTLIQVVLIHPGILGGVRCESLIGSIGRGFGVEGGHDCCFCGCLVSRRRWFVMFSGPSYLLSLPCFRVVILFAFRKRGQ